MTKTKIDFNDIGMYLTFTVTLSNYSEEESEKELDCSQEIKKVEDIVRFIDLYNKQDYQTLFKGHLETNEIDDIETVEMGTIVHIGKNENGDLIRVTSCGIKHQAFISLNEEKELEK